MNIILHHKACNFRVMLRKFCHVFSICEIYQARVEKQERKSPEYLMAHFLYISLVSLITLVITQVIQCL